MAVICPFFLWAGLQLHTKWRIGLVIIHLGMEGSLAHSIFNSSFDCLQHMRADTKSELNDPQEISIKQIVFQQFLKRSFSFFCFLSPIYRLPPSPTSDVQPQISRGIETTQLLYRGETPLFAMQV